MSLSDQIAPRNWTRTKSSLHFPPSNPATPSSLENAILQAEVTGMCSDVTRDSVNKLLSQPEGKWDGGELKSPRDSRAMYVLSSLINRAILNKNIRACRIHSVPSVRT